MNKNEEYKFLNEFLIKILIEIDKENTIYKDIIKNESSSPEKYILLKEKLKELGWNEETYIDISFEGSGDEGDYTEVDTNIPQEDLLSDSILSNLLARFIKWDWCNSEGGHGILIIKPMIPFIKNDGYKLFTTYDSINEEYTFTD